MEFTISVGCSCEQTFGFFNWISYSSKVNAPNLEGVVLRSCSEQCWIRIESNPIDLLFVPFELECFFNFVELFRLFVFYNFPNSTIWNPSCHRKIFRIRCKCDTIDLNLHTWQNQKVKFRFFYEEKAEQKRRLHSNCRITCAVSSVWSSCPFKLQM